MVGIGCLSRMIASFARRMSTHTLSSPSPLGTTTKGKNLTAYVNGLFLPHLNYVDIVWGDQSGLTTQMKQLQSFQNRFVKKIVKAKVSSAEVLMSLRWVSLHARRFGRRCCVVQDAMKGSIPEHFGVFRSTMNQQHGYNTRNGYMPKVSRPRTEW